MKKFIKSIVPDALKESYRNHKKQQEDKAEMARFQGNDVLCPVCHSSFKVFADYGHPTRKNASCHTCGSLERHRLLHLFLSERKNLFSPETTVKRLLHFAPERIFYDVFDKIDRMEYTTCDLIPERYNYDGRSRLVKVDICAIPFEDESFDFILCNHVLEHIPDDHLAMTELHRVMTKNGSGVFQVPLDYSRETTYEDASITSPEDREREFGQDDHVRWYGQDYKDRLEKAGFKVNEIDYKAKLSAEDRFKYGLNDSELIYYCEKQ